MSADQPVSTPPTITPLGECALLLRWPDRIDPAINDAVHACAGMLRAAAPAWIDEIVPAYASLAVLLDVERCLDRGIDLQTAHVWLRDTLTQPPPSHIATPRLIEIPLRYGGEAGPDLQQVAEHCGLDPNEVVARHSAAENRVAMLGFAPGFPYLIGLDPALATPRRARPRNHVPAGSVGIGGGQTGIYPQASPGGWQLIGRTPLQLFDPARKPPSLLAPGDRLRFVAAPR